MGGSPPAPPPPPDPVATAGAQTAENVDTAIANNAMSHVNQTDQFGDTSIYSQNGTYQMTDPLTGAVYNLPEYSQQTTLSPQEQAIYNEGQSAEYGMANTANTLIDRASSNLATPFDPGSLNMPSLNMPTYSTADTANAVNSLISTTGAGAWEQPMQYEQAQQQNQLNQNLADQGFSVNDAGWNQAENNLQLSQNLQNDQYASQMFGTANQSVQQQEALNSQNALSGYQANAAAAENQFAQNLSAKEAAYNLPINELTALESGSQINNATFQPTATPQIPTTDYAGIVQNTYQDQLQAYQLQNQANQQNQGGLFGLAGSIIGGGLTF